MNPERHQRVMQILGEAIEREHDSLVGWLDTVCAGDEALRREVVRLLARQKPAAQFMEESPLAAPAESNGRSMIGERVGLYKIISEIGRGGMGAVYLAERDDQQFKKRVAVKLIKRGMDTDFVVQRFRHERQILANLDHPNIARLLDGGATEADLPYFIMEYVEGESIIKYANANKLSTTQRLKLFRTVCSAVQYAHQNLVIHRDLKPSNILVTKDGEPKLLDFGIAKLLQADGGAETELTATAVRVMTPEYASPEQVKGERITTASDVYSLGVLLYELLTGQRPYRVRSRQPEEIAKAICEQEPERPSAAVRMTAFRVPTSVGSSGRDKSPTEVGTLNTRNLKLLRGDLDNIVLKALRKEPGRRYASVEQFSEDIRRHLEGLPVGARKDTLSYRTSKFVQRNKIGVAAAAIILLTLVGGIITTAWQAHVARVQSARADQRFNQVRELAHSVLFDYHDAIASLPGSTPVRERLVKDALKYLDNLSRESGNDQTLLRELGTAYEKIAQIQGNSYYANLGDSDGALQSYRKSLELRERLLAADPNNREFQSDLAASHQGIGDVLYGEGDLPATLQSYERSLRLREVLMKSEPASIPYRRALAEAYTRVGDVKGMEGYANLGDVAGALENYSNAEALMEILAAADPKNHEVQFSLAAVLTAAGMLMDVTGNVTGALGTERRAVGLLDQLIAAEPNNNEYRLQLLATFAFLRYALIDSNHTAEAIENSRKAIVILQAMVAADPKNTAARRDLEVVYNSLGKDLLMTGSVPGALESHRNALAICDALSTSDPNSEQYKSDVAFTLQRLGEAQAVGHDNRAAIENYRQARAIREGTLKGDSSNARARSDVSAIYADLGNALAATGDTKEALEDLAKSVPIAEELSARSPANAKLKAQLARRHFELATVHLRFAQTLRESGAAREHWQAARDSFTRSLNVWQDMKNKGTLIDTDVRMPDKIAGEIAKCDAALKKLGAP
jgi:serine/threonine protein kinase